MKLHQVHYFVRVIELGGIKKAARDLGVVPSAVSKQLRLLEEELNTQLLKRMATGVEPTEAGKAFLAHSRLGLRHLDNAVEAARNARLSGVVSIGMASTTASILTQPLVAEMQLRYPAIRLHLVENLAGNLTSMLHMRQLDLAVLYQMDIGAGWSVIPVLSEALFLVARQGMLPFPDGRCLSMKELVGIPLALTSRSHGLRLLVEAAFRRMQIELVIGMEVDGLSTLMSIVRNNGYATIQPGAAVVATDTSEFSVHPLDDPYLKRTNMVTSASDDELSPTALATRIVLVDLMRKLVKEGKWPGATALDW